MIDDLLLDQLLLYLYNNAGKKFSILSNEIGFVPTDDFDRIITELVKIDFVDQYQNKQQSLARNTTFYNYEISSKGVQFIDRLPIEYKDKPYTFYLKEKNEKEQLELKKLKSEIEDLSNKVNNFKSEKRISIFALIISAGAFAVSLLSALKGC